MRASNVGFSLLGLVRNRALSEKSEFLKRLGSLGNEEDAY